MVESFPTSLKTVQNGAGCVELGSLGGKGYVYRGTGSSDFYESRNFAEGLLEEFKLKLKLDQSITGHNLSKTVAEFETHIRATRLKTGRHAQRNTLMFLLSVDAGLRAKEIASLERSMITDAA